MITHPGRNPGHFLHVDNAAEPALTSATKGQP